MRRGEMHCERGALGLAHHGGALAPRGVHDRPDVVHPLLEGRRSGHAVGHSHSTLVEEDQARELTQPLAVPSKLRQLPADLEMRVRALRVDQIDRPVADDAVRDVDVAAARESDLRHA
jgi:hypothetical protein